MYVSLCQSLYLSIYISTYLCLYLVMCILSICDLSVCLLVCLSLFCLFISIYFFCLPIYLLYMCLYLSVFGFLFCWISLRLILSFQHYQFNSFIYFHLPLPSPNSTTKKFVQTAGADRPTWLFQCCVFYHSAPQQPYITLHSFLFTSWIFLYGNIRSVSLALKSVAILLYITLKDLEIILP